MSGAESGGPAKQPKGRELDLPSWRRIGEFVRNILRLERSVEALSVENRELDHVSARSRGKWMSRPGN